jgi:hypothetical protein
MYGVRAGVSIMLDIRGMRNRWPLDAQSFPPRGEFSQKFLR